MKKLLLSLTVLALIASACGASDEDRAKAQAENEKAVNEKVNELLESIPTEAAATSDSVAIDMDSAAADTTAAPVE
ncbi:MAG: hypothetical protein HQ500_13210 [Flavobacteriales bacterium]|nr:hypothetical protein [Flavobacteriales bacterium]